jgi:hypothetical protein
MTLIKDKEEVYETDLSLDEVIRAINFLLKERERVKVQARKRRQAFREANPLPPKEPKEPKKYYKPSGNPRGRPKKVQPVPECDAPAF